MEDDEFEYELNKAGKPKKYFCDKCDYRCPTKGEPEQEDGIVSVNLSSILITTNSLWFQVI